MPSHIILTLVIVCCYLGNDDTIAYRTAWERCHYNPLDFCNNANTYEHIPPSVMISLHKLVFDNDDDVIAPKPDF